MPPPFTPIGTVPPSPPAGPSTTLPYSVIKHDPGMWQWCWAAVAAGVKHFYAPAGSAVPSQCKIATDTLLAGGQLAAGASCCPSAPGSVCDRDYTLDAALRTVGRFRTGPDAVFDPWAVSPALGGQSPAAVIAGEIGSGRVLGVRLAVGVYPGPPPRPRGHFVVLHGYEKSSAGEFVDVGDPDPTAGSASRVALSRLWTGYSTGTWSHVYTTG